jgi:hypothetical protein
MITKSTTIKTVNGLFTIVDYFDTPCLEKDKTFVFRVDNITNLGTVNIWISREHLLELSQAIKDHLEEK